MLASSPPIFRHPSGRSDFSIQTIVTATNNVKTTRLTNRTKVTASSSRSYVATESRTKSSLQSR